MKFLFIVFSVFFGACSLNTVESEKKVSEKNSISADSPISGNGKNILERFVPPEGYHRVKAPNDSFAQYLRSLRLKPVGTKVRYYNGETKPTFDDVDVYAAVVDLPIGTKDLHQCADAVMRLKAEYLWQQKKYDQIHFNFTNGFRVDYSEWMKGKRMKVSGNKTSWVHKKSPANSYEDFWEYMELIFMYAGTASLEKELKPVNIDDAQIGDVLIRGGHPGHAVIIVDKVTNIKTNKNLYLLAQSYMPAQEIQVLRNFANQKLSPWYELMEGDISTPEWPFNSKHLRRFDQ